MAAALFVLPSVKLLRQAKFPKACQLRRKGDHARPANAERKALLVARPLPQTHDIPTAVAVPVQADDNGRARVRAIRLQQIGGGAQPFLRKIGEAKPRVSVFFFRPLHIKRNVQRRLR